MCVYEYGRCAYILAISIFVPIFVPILVIPIKPKSSRALMRG